MRFEPLLVQKVGGVGGVQGERAVPDVHLVSLPDHVEAADPGEPGYAVGREGAPRLAAMGQHAAAREDVGLALAHHDLLCSAPHRVDDHDARASLGRVSRLGRRGPLDQREEHQGDDHWFGSVN